MTDLNKLEWMKRLRIVGWLGFVGLCFLQGFYNTAIKDDILRGTFNWMIGMTAGILFWNLFVTLQRKIKELRKSIETKL